MQAPVRLDSTDLDDFAVWKEAASHDGRRRHDADVFAFDSSVNLRNKCSLIAFVLEMRHCGSYFKKCVIVGVTR